MSNINSKMSQIGSIKYLFIYLRLSITLDVIDISTFGCIQTLYLRVRVAKVIYLYNNKEPVDMILHNGYYIVVR